MGQEKKSELKKVKKLIDLMIEHDLVEVEIVSGEDKIHLKRPGSSQPQFITAANAPAQPAAVQSPAPQESSAPQPDDLASIDSPIIGTFYAAPAPDAEPFVKVGDHVTADTVVCIVEAMKVMNEIKAETSGTVIKAMVENGQAVEFGQTLFKIKPD